MQREFTRCSLPPQTRALLAEPGDERSSPVDDQLAKPAEVLSNRCQRELELVTARPTARAVRKWHPSRAPMLCKTPDRSRLPFEKRPQVVLRPAGLKIDKYKKLASPGSLRIRRLPEKTRVDSGFRSAEHRSCDQADTPSIRSTDFGRLPRPTSRAGTLICTLPPSSATKAAAAALRAAGWAAVMRRCFMSRGLRGPGRPTCRF